MRVPISVKGYHTFLHATIYSVYVGGDWGVYFVTQPSHVYFHYIAVYYYGTHMKLLATNYPSILSIADDYNSAINAIADLCGFAYTYKTILHKLYISI